MTSSPLSRRALAVEESATLAVAERAATLRAQGVDVISFGAGEPDFDTPDFIKKAAVDALAKGLTKYTASSGIAPLRKAVAAKLARENGLTYPPEQILISCGAKHSIYNAMQALLDEGDEVLIPAPYWTSYPEMVKTTGATPRPVATNEAFKLGPDALARAITPRTKMLIHCSPSNPTGAVYTKAETAALAEIAAAKKLWVISDEVYEKMIYGGSPHVSIATFPGMSERAIVVNSCSKSFAMTGWRIGFAAGARELIDAMGRLQGQATSNPTSIAQYAAVAAYEGDPACLTPMIREYEKRRDYVVKRLKAMPKVSIDRPDGAFYAFPRVDGHYGRKLKGETIQGSIRFCERMLDHAKIAIVPGIAFGSDAHVRLSYATSMEKIEEGLNRFEAFLKSLE